MCKFYKAVVINTLIALTNNNLSIIADSDNFKENGIFDMTVTINGIEINPNEFIESILQTVCDKEIDLQHAQNKYNSKNSPNAKLSKINKQLGMVKTMLQNIDNTLNELK